MKNQKRSRLMAAVLSVVLALVALPVTAAAAGADDAVVYDAAEISPFKDRTIQEISERYSAARYAGASYSESDSSTWYSTPSSTKAPYAAGVLTEDTHTAMTAMTNFYRWLVGVPELTAASQHSDSLQAQALDRNFEFAHYISNSSKPADMDQALWDAGYLCDHNILAMGYTPQGAITGWLNEGYNTNSQTFDTFGHRYSLLDANRSNVQFGYSGRIAIGKNVSNQNTMDIPFTAFPAPGYMPANLVTPSRCGWSVEFNRNVIRVNDASAVVVTVTNCSTGDSYQCTAASGTVQFTSSKIEFVQPTASGRYSGEYSVEITGLTDAATGKEAVIRYTTTFFDISESAPSYITRVSTGVSEYVVYNTMANSLDKVASLLPDEVTVTSEAGGTATVKVSGKWTVDEANNCFVNSADASQLPSHLTDKNGLLNRITIPYTISDSYFDAYNSLSITPSNVSSGDTVTFRIYRTHVFSDTSQIFKLTENADGTYSADKKFDSSVSADFDKEQSDANSPYHIYTHTAAEEDSGEYISVYFDPGIDSTTYYVSTSTRNLTVKPCDHVPGDAVIENRKEATCSETGSYDSVVYCSVCGDEISRTVEIIDKIDHTAAEAVRENETAATCTKAGSYDSVVYCSVCGSEISRQTVEIPMLEHQYSSQVTEPTCTEKGYTTYTCRQCSSTYVDDYKDALGHDYVKSITKEPTADESGAATYTCSRCGDSYTEEIAALGHNWDSGVVTKEPTCTETGIKTYTCTDSGCGRTYTEVIPAKGHTEGSAVRENEAAPTCTKTGSYDSVVYCTVCREELSRTTTVLAMIDHTAGAAVKENEVLPTCTKEGSYDSVVYCTACGKELSRSTVVLDKIDHTASEAVKENETAAACTKAGSYDSVVYCSVCGGEISRQTVEIPMLEHDYKSQIIAPTCTEKGFTTHTCQKCGGVYIDNYADALGHDYVKSITKEPTADDSGVMTYKCSRCGDSYTEAIAPFGHNWDDGVVTKEASCTEAGIKTYTCKDPGCGRTYTEEIPAKGHTSGEPVIENEAAPTCTKDGSYDSVVYCTVCDEEISRTTVVLDALGHTYKYSDNGDGTHTVSCAECDMTSVEDHVYKDGVCAQCGAKEPVEPGVPTEPEDTDKPEDSNKPESGETSGKPQTSVTTQKPGSTANTNDKTTSSVSANTGDTQNPMMWGVLIAVSAVGLTIVLIKKKYFDR